MAIDPDVQVLLDEADARFDALVGRVVALEELAMAPPAPSPEPQPPAPEPPPWGNIGRFLPAGFAAAYDLPVGHLGHNPSLPLIAPPADVATLSGGVWSVQRDWSASVEGFSLDFGEARIDLIGHHVSGAVLRLPNLTSGKRVAIDGGGLLSYFTASNPAGNSCDVFTDIAVHSFVVLGANGDVFKNGTDDTGEAFDGFVSMMADPGDSSGKHYDCAQTFFNGHSHLERVVIDWADIGTVAATTGAMFTQHTATSFARDIHVLHPGGTWFPLRPTSSGVDDWDRIHIWGERKPVAGRNQLAPTAVFRVLVESDMPNNFVNDVPDARDFVIA